ncbi:radical SAM protein, partial [Candidatus Peregrinibacteria bacterium]|nr:radical SAM protein [Candidatus Peregrinibacteria bacterium]
MENFGRKAYSKETVLRVFKNLFLPEKYKAPLVAVFYGNDTCNGRCAFCSQHSQVEKAKTSGQTDLASQKRILSAIRQDVPNIYLMGGEPSIHPHLEELLAECERLDFDTIGINTNAVIYRPEILEHANMLVISLFSVDPLKVGAKLLPDLCEEKQTKLGMNVIENAERYIKESDPERTVVIINKVVTGEEGDISGVFGLVNFCRKRGIKLNIAPAVMDNNRPDPRLPNNPVWEFLIDFLLRNMDLMACSSAYLKTIKRFESFDCTPNAVPAIRQNGDIAVPCPHVNDPAVVNLLEAGGVMKALRQGREEFGEFNPHDRCKEQCHKTCFVEAANLSDETFVLEALRKLFGKRINGTAEDQDYSYVGLLLEFCMEDMHDYDSAIGDYLLPIARKNKFFEELIKELSDRELSALKNCLSEIWDYFHFCWEITGSEAKAAYLIVDIVNQFATRPFTPIFQRIQKVTGK